MKIWDYTLKIQDEWKQALNNQITVQKLAEVIEKKLEAIDFGAEDNYRRDQLVEEFSRFSEDETGDKDDFDEIFAELYDFADEVHLWVQTII